MTRPPRPTRLTLSTLYATRLPPTRARPVLRRRTRIYLAALDSLIAHLEAQGMPTGARAVRREHVESFLADERVRAACTSPADRL